MSHLVTESQGPHALYLANLPRGRSPKASQGRRFWQSGPLLTDRA